MEKISTTRCIQLQPLSHEHVCGAAFIGRVRNGIDKIADERLRNYVLWYWKNHIRPHFFQEEKILLPYMDAGNTLSVKLKEDHTCIRQLVLSLDQHADRQSFIMLCDLIDEHVRFEEKELFTWLEAHLEEDILNAINRQLLAHPVETSEWNDCFWQ